MALDMAKTILTQANTPSKNRRAYRYYLNHKDDPEFKASQKIARRKWYRSRGRSKEIVYARKWESEHPEAVAKWRLTWNEKRRQTRIEVLTHYGGNPPKCACCNEDILEFLSIDHVNGGGRQHRAKIFKTNSGSGAFYLWLKRQGFPEGYRILCYNCNCALGHYGYCPHRGR